MHAQPAEAGSADTRTIHGACGNCGASLTLAATERTTICPYCDTPTVAEKPVDANLPAPAFVVGFVTPKDDATRLVRDWIRSKALFARSGFAKATFEKTRGVYVPGYLYGAEAHSHYSAEIGENYTETYTTTDSKGNTVTRTRTKTEWRSLQGVHGFYVTDRIVTASRGIENDALEEIEPFDLRAMRRYDPSMIAGWSAEDPSRTQEECLYLAHQEALDSVGQALQSFMPGDSYRGLQYQSNFQNEHIELIMIPVWVFTAKYDPEREAVQIIVNGQTGRLHGKVPYSPLKITLAILVAVALIVGVILYIVYGAKS